VGDENAEFGDRRSARSSACACKEVDGYQETGAIKVVLCKVG